MKQFLKQNINIPNTLTALRLVIIPPMIYFLLGQEYVKAGLMLLISALSDMLDGLIARKLHQITDLGKILDPIADKMTLMAVVVCVNVLYPHITPFVLALFLKELLMLSGGAFLLKIKLRPPAAKWYGKISTIIFYTSIITMILLKAVWGIMNGILTIVMLTLTTASMLFSLCMYTLLFLKMVREREKIIQQNQELLDVPEENQDVTA